MYKYDPLKHYLSRFFLLGISLLVSVLAVEVILSRFFVFRSDQWAPYYPLGFETAGMSFDFVQREFDTRIEFNSSGFRDIEIPLSKDETKLRLLFVGDSFVEGFGVSQEERFSSVLSNIAVGDLEIINVGQNATGPISYLSNLTEFGFALDPDVVIVTFFVGNDFNLGRDYEFLEGKDLIVKNTLPKKTIGFSGLDSVVRLEYIKNAVEQIFFEGESISQFLVRKRNFSKYWNYYFREEVNFNFFVKRSSLSEQEVRIWLEELDTDVREDFLNGMINPGYGIGALTSRVSDLSSGSYYNESDFKGVCRIFDLIDSTAAVKSTELVFLSLPALHQLDPAYHLNHLESDFLYKTIPSQLYELEELNDRLIRYLEKRSNFNIIDMRMHLEKEDFYLFDEHLRASGHKKVAAQLKHLFEEVHFYQK